MKALLSVVALCLFGVVGLSADFRVLSDVEGVKNVEYDAPFLFVVVQNQPKIEQVAEAVRAVLKGGEDVDAAALGNGVRLRVVTQKQCDEVKREKRLVRDADTASELRALMEASRFGSLYQLDWTRADVVVSRDRFVKWYFPPDAAELEDEIATVRGFIERMRNRERRPERVVFIHMRSVGSLVYPVFDGDIRTMGTAIPYAEFVAELPAPGNG